MELNQYIDLQKKVSGATPQEQPEPTVDHSEGANIALDIAKRQAEKPPEETPKIPSAGATPIPN